MEELLLEAIACFCLRVPTKLTILLFLIIIFFKFFTFNIIYISDKYFRNRIGFPTFLYFTK